MQEAETAEASRRRVRWQCRRGMRELDLVLQAFIAHGYEKLGSAERTRFAWLLEQPDAVLIGWLLETAPPIDEGMRRLVAKIRQSLDVSGY